MKHIFYTLDVFTEQRFSGNPLAVILGADDLSGDEMQTITREFNLSESIFVLKPENPQHTARVRIFTPSYEMAFAGHPTIGCAILLASLHADQADCETVITLEENAGLVPVKMSCQQGRWLAQLTAPVIPFNVESPLPDAGLVAQALNLESGDIGFDRHKLRILEGGPRFLYVPIASRAALARAKVVEPYWARALAVMSGVDSLYLYCRDATGETVSFHARMFSSEWGIPEDPATGAATAVLAAQLILSEGLSEGSHRWTLSQGEDMGRPSTLYLEVDVAKGKLQAVRVAGSAVRVMDGTIAV